MNIDASRATSQFGDSRAIPTTRPRRLAATIATAETNSVFIRPTTNARP
jgi:hypothetical protein